MDILWPMFLLALFAVLAVKLYRFWQRERGQGGGGDFGPGGPGRGWDSGPRTSPRGPRTDPDGLWEVPYEWVEAHGKWANKIVRDSRKSIEAR